MGGVLGVSRACDRFPSKFQNFERHCSKTALDEKKWGIPAVPLKILKLAWEPIAGPWDPQNPPHFRPFSIQWWPQIIDMSESKWPKNFDMTKKIWPKKCHFFFDLLASPGAPGPKIVKIILYIFFGIRITDYGGVIFTEYGIRNTIEWSRRKPRGGPGPKNVPVRTNLMNN